MTYNVLTVANVFLDKLGRTQLHALKLQKLVFYAHGWYLALHESPLIREDFQAWHRGPVVPELYYANKNRKIGKLSQIEPKEVINDQDLWFLQKVYALYKPYSGYQLSELTHQRGAPWYETCKKYLDKDDELPIGLVIQQSAIQEHFSSLLKNSRK